MRLNYITKTAPSTCIARGAGVASDALFQMGQVGFGDLRLTGGWPRNLNSG